jgi:osmotically-inducible protein OsmY
VSSNARNVKVIASWHGTVTLKGPVSSAEEKRVIEMKAAEIAGPDNVNTVVFVAAKMELDRSK